MSDNELFNFDHSEVLKFRNKSRIVGYRGIYFTDDEYRRAGMTIVFRKKSELTIYARYLIHERLYDVGYLGFDDNGEVIFKPYTKVKHVTYDNADKYAALMQADGISQTTDEQQRMREFIANPKAVLAFGHREGYHCYFQTTRNAEGIRETSIYSRLRT